MKRLYAGKLAYSVVFRLILPLCALVGVLLSATGIYAVQPPQSPVQTTLSGKNWAYTVPFAVKNVADIEALHPVRKPGREHRAPG